MTVRCDVCGKPASEHDQLHSLLNWKKETQHLCVRCKDLANKMLNHYRKMAWLRTKKFLKRRAVSKVEG